MSLWPSSVKHLLLQNGTYQARDIRSGSKRKREPEEREIEGSSKTYDDENGNVDVGHQGHRGGWA
jgi:hypothetical protein